MLTSVGYIPWRLVANGTTSPLITQGEVEGVKAEIPRSARNDRWCAQNDSGVRGNAVVFAMVSLTGSLNSAGPSGYLCIGLGR